MSHYKAYPEYKDSEIQWIEEIPSHWRIIPIKRFAKLNKARTSESGEKIIYIGLEDVESGSGRYLPTEGNSRQTEDSTVGVFEKGQVLYGKLRPYLRKAIIANFDGVCSTEFLVLQSEEVLPELLQSWLLSTNVTQQIEATCEGAKMPRADWEGIGNIPMPLPPSTEQALIRDKVKTETTRIDNLITKKNRFIELLNEKRQALITHAVTKGLNPAVKVKDSRVEWIGEVPEHWVKRKVFHAYERIGSGTTPPSKEFIWYEDGTIPWITTSELRENEVFDTKKKVTLNALNTFSALKIFPAGSLAIAMYGATIGRLGFLGVPATTNQACCVLSGEIDINSKFLYYWLMVFKSEIIYLFSEGGGQPNINQDVVANLRVPSPNVSEQKNIVDYIEIQLGSIDTLINKTQESIALLKERRSAFITAAVTGQIDLRGDPV